MKRVGKAAERARGLLAGFTPGQRGVLVVGLLVIVLGAFALSRWAAQPTWTPLYSNLSGSDANAIVEQLRGQGVQYELSNGGTTILVPQSQVYDLRVGLSGKGLPAGGSDTNGYSLLDKQGMTATDFQQNVAYQRALEGELGKTLQAIQGVNTAVVHLAIPKKDVFTTEADHPTASVLLALAPGTTLSRSQIRSVMHLVAGGVPGLDPSDVTVTDGQGNLLSVREDGRAGAAGAASDADQQTQAFEDAKSASVQKMLDNVLGKGKAVVRVNAELNYDNSDTTSESYVSQTGLSPLSEATSSESYGNVAGANGGALGQAFPSLTPGVGYGSGGGTYVKVDRTVNNPVGKVVSRTQSAPGSVKRLTVAVMLDSKTTADPVQLQKLVENAVGADTRRGDTVAVNKIAFDTTDAQTTAKALAEAQAAERTQQYIGLGTKAAIGLALLIALVVVMRRRAKARPPKVEAVATDLPAPAAVGAAGEAGPSLLPSTLEEQLAIASAAHKEEADVLDPSLERELLRDEVSKLVDQSPEELAIIVQSWVGQRK